MIRPDNSNLQNCVIRQIRQIFGCLCHSGLRYSLAPDAYQSACLATFCRSYQKLPSTLTNKRLERDCLRYGVITTYDYSWFLCRSFEGPKLLLISPAISYDSRDPTILQCFFHLASLARDDKHRAPSPDSCFSTDRSNLTSDFDSDYQSGFGQKRKRNPSHRNAEKNAEKKELRRSRRNAGRDVEESRNINLVQR